MSSYESYDPEEDLSCLESFRYINGRRFHNERNTINYYYPNDSEETNRLNIQHNLLRYVWKGNYSSPITEKLKRGNTSVLDIGCKGGVWVLDMAQKYPQSSFIGIDVSSMTSPSNKTPLNAIFLQHSIVTEGLPWPPNTFDFIHQRFASMSFSQADFAKLLREMYRVTKVDGWIEIMNFSTKIKNCGKKTKKLMDAMVKFHESKNFKLLESDETIKMLEAVGVTNIKYEERYTPIGKWSDQVDHIGEISMLNFTMGYSGLKIYLAPFMKLTIEQFDDLLREIEKEFDINQSYVHTYRIYGKSGKKSYDA